VENADHAIDEEPLRSYGRSYDALTTHALAFPKEGAGKLAKKLAEGMTDVRQAMIVNLVWADC
jgi:hypothetical protein